MKIYDKLEESRKSLKAARPIWIPNPAPDFKPLWPFVGHFIGFFIVTQGISLLTSLGVLGLPHPLTIVQLLLFVIVPIFTVMITYVQSMRGMPNEIYMAAMTPWVFRLFVLFGVNISLITSVTQGIFMQTFVVLLIASCVIELLAYMAYRSYDDKEIRIIIAEHGVFSDINGNNEFWVCSLGGDVGSDRLLIKSKWHLKVFYAMGAVAPLAFVSGGKIGAPILAAFISIALYFIAHGMFTGVYVVRRGLQLRLEGKL